MKLSTRIKTVRYSTGGKHRDNTSHETKTQGGLNIQTNQGAETEQLRHIMKQAITLQGRREDRNQNKHTCNSKQPGSARCRASGSSRARRSSGKSIRHVENSMTTMVTGYAPSVSNSLNSFFCKKKIKKFQTVFLKLKSYQNEHIPLFR